MPSYKTDLWDGDKNLLYPETEWASVIGRPPFENNNEEILFSTNKKVNFGTEGATGTATKMNLFGNNTQITGGSFHFNSSEEEIVVADPLTNGKKIPLSNYPRSLGALKAALPDSVVFGVVRDANLDDLTIEYPAMRIKTLSREPNPQGLPTLVTLYKTYYINESGDVTRFAGSGYEFIPAIG